MNTLDELIEGILDTPLAEIDEGAPFAEVSDWDSMKQVQLVVGIQSRFDVELEREEIQQLTCVAEIRRVLSERGLEV